MRTVVEQAATDILQQAHGKGYRAALFAMGLMPALIALGAKLGNKCEIMPMLRYRENGLWYWPVNEPRGEFYMIDGLDRLSDCEGEVCLRLGLTAVPESMHSTAESLGMSVVSVIARAGYLGNGALGHPDGGASFRQRMQELLQRLASWIVNAASNFMKPYRWDIRDFATGYDVAAEHIHPYYTEIHDEILKRISVPQRTDFLLVDAGGGSGRFVERFLTRFKQARAIIVDQSEAFLNLAKRRLFPFEKRTHFFLNRLQENWFAHLPEAPSAIVSMSAVHHLDSDEKRAFYERCYDALPQDGVFLNGDEVRAADDADYLAQCKFWVAHMHKVMESDLVPAVMHEALIQWESRNVHQFGTPRVSGDDCHETIEAHLGYLTACGFSTVNCPWQKGMWSILCAVK